MIHLIKPTTGLCGEVGMLTHDITLVDCPSCKHLHDHDGRAPEADGNNQTESRTYFDGRVTVNSRRPARTAHDPVVAQD